MKPGKLTEAAVCATMILAALTACGGGSSSEVDAPALMSKVTRHEIDYNTGEWYVKSITEYEYDNAYPVSIREHDYDSGTDTETTFEYTFRGELPSKMMRFNDDGVNDLMCSYTKEGLRNREHYYDMYSNTEKIYQYGNRDEYFTLVHHETLSFDPEDPDGPKDHAEETDSVIVSSEDGLLVKTVNDGLYANWGDLETKEWHRFMGSYTMDYDSSGIAATASAVYSNGLGSGDQIRFTLSFRDGRVSEAVVSMPFPDDNGETVWNEMTKYEFEYTDIEISKARYASMINDVMTEGGSNYYIYNWY